MAAVRDLGRSSREEEYRSGRASARRRPANVYTGGVTNRVLVTGANGFVGRTLCPVLEDAGTRVRAAVKDGSGRLPGSCDGDVMSVGNIGADTAWLPALKDVEVVVHLAGRVHVLRETVRDPQAEFHKVNVLGTEHLARVSARAGVKRIVYVSSIGVNGRRTTESAFSETHEPSPHNAYALSKWEAEQVLREVSEETGIEVVILRPPLIYGPGVKANFLRLMELVNLGLPLPMGSIDNRRSLLYVGNLADAISKCIQAPEASGKTFLVSDGEDVSTPELVRRIRKALGVSTMVLPLPTAAIRLAAYLARRASSVEPLLDSLVIDSTEIRRTLGWQPPYTLDQGMRETAAWFKNSRVEIGKGG